MQPTTSLIVADKPAAPVFTVAPAALQFRDRALTLAAEIGRVENADQNTAAVRAHSELKRVSLDFEKERKKLKEPLLDAGRQLDRAVATALADVEKEIGRIANLTGEFNLAEQRRVREEQDRQRLELERIERERQAEIARVAREQAERERAIREEAERKAREEREAAEKLAREATTKRQREAAEAARVETERHVAEMRAELDRREQESKNVAAAQMQQANEAAEAARLAESKPIEATRAVGQVIKSDWDITVTNPIQFAKNHPDCVTWERLPVSLSQIKEHLNAGRTLVGITAKKITVSGVRPKAAIEV